MIRRVLFTIVALSMVAPLMAQAPKGWKLRVDRSTSATDPDASGAIRFMQMGPTLHAVNPQAAVYWNPANKASGNYTLKGTFTLMKPSGHTNYYGLVFGGADLEGPTQYYTYFLVAQDGTWLIKQRNGDAVTATNPSNVAPKTANAIVNKPGADGTSVNALEVRVLADKIDYVVNGTVVTSTPKAAAKTDGIYGFRINHMLEVQVNDFGLSK